MTKFDVSTAISAHKHWKSRLSLLLGDLQKAQLDPIEVGDPVRCELGKWIAMEIATIQYDSLLNSLDTTHAEFHRLAAVIVSLANNGQNRDAKLLLDNEFAELSADVVDLLSEVSIRSRPESS
jgi:hypothetical protein